MGWQQRHKRAFGSVSAFWALVGLSLALGFSIANPASLQAAPQRVIINALEYPWSAIGRVNTGGEGYCTGFLISENKVMTAAHCLYDFPEGRWRAPFEIHFIAGYQFEEYKIHSRVVGYEKAPGVRPLEKVDLNYAITDWAILTLAEPIGLKAGWLGLKIPNGRLISDAKAGRARLFQVGYSAKRPHAMTVSGNCRLDSVHRGGLVLAHDCEVLHGDSGSPLLIYENQRVYAVGLHVMDFRRNGKSLAGALSNSAFTGAGRSKSRAPNLAGSFGAGHAPAPDSPAGQQPKQSIDRLLKHFGYLNDKSDPNDTLGREAAIQAFRKNAGLGSGTPPPMKLLGELIAAIR